MRKAALALALVLVSGGSANAQRTPGTDETLKWGMTAIKGVDDWHVLQVTEFSITFASPDGATLMDDGTVEGVIRDEYRRPMDVGGGKALSMLIQISVDCKAQRYRMLKMAAYAENNVQRRYAEREGEGAWFPRSEERAQVMDALCEAVQHGKKLD